MFQTVLKLRSQSDWHARIPRRGQEGTGAEGGGSVGTVGVAAGGAGQGTLSSNCRFIFLPSTSKGACRILGQLLSATLKQAKKCFPLVFFFGVANIYADSLIISNAQNNFN